MKIIIIGDSISEGIGRKKINYIPLLMEKIREIRCSVEIINFSLTGSTIKYPLENIEMIVETKPDIVVVMYGSVDVQVRPDLSKNKYGLVFMTPKRYKSIGGMLNPRPFCSSKFFRNKLDKLDNFFRFILKKVITLTQGSYQYMTCGEFQCYYEKLIETLLMNKCMLVLLSTVYLDEKIYPGSNYQYIKCNRIINKMAHKYNLQYIDVYKEFENVVKERGWDSIYYKDNFHPNIHGYEIIAEQIYNTIKGRVLNE